MNTAHSIANDRTASRRNLPRHPVFMPQALPADFGKTPSQRAIVDIIGEFLPRYGYGSQVLHVGDPAMGCLICDDERLGKLGLNGAPHEKLPAIVAYSTSRRWLYLIESAHPPGPITPDRHLELMRLTDPCKAGILFITAFPNRSSLRKSAADIPWETDVWIVDEPDHMIHFNGNRIPGPYPSIRGKQR
jgi:type II restriction enzyme